MEITPEQAHKHLDQFKPCYCPDTGKWLNDIPKDVKLTVWIERDRAFMIDDYLIELGIDRLIATSWIEHDKLVELCCA